MSDRYGDYEDRLLTDGKDESFDSQTVGEPTGNKAEEYYELPSDGAARNMIWSLLSLIFGILSVVTCQVYVLSMILASLGVGASLYSRKRFGYFDKLSVVGLIISIFGLVFGFSAMVISLSGLFNF